MGAPLAVGTPYCLDWEAYYAQGGRLYAAPSWFVHASAESGEEYTLYASLPALVQTLEAKADLAPLSRVLETLRALAGKGLLRAINRLTLGYGTFAVAGEEGGDALLEPVWTANVEIYPDAQSEAHTVYGEVWRGEGTLYIDARTGELIEREWVEGWPQGSE